MNFLSFAPFEKNEKFLSKMLTFHGLNPIHKMDQTTAGKHPNVFVKKKLFVFFLKKEYSEFFFSEFSKSCLKNSSKGAKNNELKI